MVEFHNRPGLKTKLDKPGTMCYCNGVVTENNMTVIKNEHGQMNMFAKEPEMYITEEDMNRYHTMNHNQFAEILNSRMAMLGVVSAIVSYVMTGKLFFGIM